ncbi:nuclear transport factor 2 family protein [Leptothoe spongobia]|uniref:Nuclear transport factor 2 family protein n=1 Tax=Leptothoe spongobia TAU-MAC 1115 TaxID=1967444 RepID=A0A947GLV9_9CYAN|nr:nuclear transport factor 2 family protein [Leptothoe spongobia]MBT9317593.1 nuclear transport factor 2 family protein [Leptothoe spongobia TAU-MAC 1115]
MSNEQNAVLEANQTFYRAFEKKDMEAMEAVCSKGIGSLCIHPGREAIKGWDAIRQSWVKIFKATRYLEIDLEVISVEVSGDLAYVVLVEKVMQVAGSRRLEAKSMATNTFERMAGQWYLVHHHGSPIMG